MSDVLANLTPLTFLILLLAGASLTRFVTTDEFPFGALRDRLFNRFPPAGYTVTRDIQPKGSGWQRLGTGIYYHGEGKWLGRLLSCDFCAGTWVAIALFTLFCLFPTFTIFVSVPLAIRIVVGRFNSGNH